MGIDSFFEIPTWKEVGEIFFTTHLIVIARPGFLVENVEDVFQNPVFSKIQFVETGEGKDFGCRSIKAEQSPYSIFIFETTPVPISATEIRDKLHKGEEISNCLPREVEKYIMEHGVYKD